MAGLFLWVFLVLETFDCSRLEVEHPLPTPWAAHPATVTAIHQWEEGRIAGNIVKDQAAAG